jgi:hypothetical protein
MVGEAEEAEGTGERWDALEIGVYSSKLFSHGIETEELKSSTTARIGESQRWKIPKGMPSFWARRCGASIGLGASEWRIIYSLVCNTFDTTYTDNQV